MNKVDILEISPYDESFPFQLLNEAFQMKLEESKNVTNQLIEDILKDNKYSVESLHKGEEKIRLVVDESNDFMKDYQNGVIKLAKEKGHVVAQIKENNLYGKKLPIKEERYIDGPTSLELMNACQLQNIAESLQELSIQIEALNENIKEVLRGQQNDRLGLYYSGVALYIEANQVSNDNLRKQLISQSLKSLTDAKYQLILTLQSDINYLARREYESNKKQKFNLLNEKINSINKSFAAIHQSTLMKAGIYCQFGEIQAMTSVFNEYALFIRNTILPNSKLLISCDINDTGKIDGTWKGRTQLLNKVNTIVEQLKISNTEVYIDYKGEITDESK